MPCRTKFRSVLSLNPNKICRVFQLPNRPSQILRRRVRVPHGHEDRGLSEQPAHRGDVHPPGHEPGGKGVSQVSGTEARPDPRSSRAFSKSRRVWARTVASLPNTGPVCFSSSRSGDRARSTAWFMGIDRLRPLLVWVTWIAPRTQSTCSQVSPMISP